MRGERTDACINSFGLVTYWFPSSNKTRTIRARVSDVASAAVVMPTTTLESTAVHGGHSFVFTASASACYVRDIDRRIHDVYNDIIVYIIINIIITRLFS